MAGYEAGAGQYSDVVWSEVGSCSGTLAPTSSPSFEALTNYGGCPREWEVKAVGEAYEPGDTVSVKGFVFGKKYVETLISYVPTLYSHLFHKTTKYL